jgi:pilus assembly protein Flp/PilA
MVVAERFVRCAGRGAQIEIGACRSDGTQPGSACGTGIPGPVHQRLGMPGAPLNTTAATGQGGSMKELWNRFIEDESGQGLVEYVLIIAVVAIGLIAALYLFRNNVGNTYENVSTRLQNEPATPWSPS